MHPTENIWYLYFGKKNNSHCQPCTPAATFASPSQPFASAELTYVESHDQTQTLRPRCPTTKGDRPVETKELLPHSFNRSICRCPKFLHKHTHTCSHFHSRYLMCAVEPKEHIRSASRYCAYHNYHTGQRVQCPGNRNPLALTSGQLNSPLANLAHIAVRHQHDIGLQCTGFQHPVVVLRSEWFTKQDVVSYVSVQQPRPLGNVSNCWISANNDAH